MQILNDTKLLRSQCYINGDWVNANDASTIDVYNPVDLSIISSVPNCNEHETAVAIESANSALKAWRQKTAAERGGILRCWYELLLSNQDDLATIMTIEQGKPLEESKGEIAYAASFLEWFSEEGKRAYGDVIPTTSNDRRIIVVKEPIGVCAAITPWNFPAAMITRKTGAALAAGCTIVLKPASQTPLSALALAVLAERAGVPKGVFNVITGNARTIGGELTSNPVVRKLSFTGSTEIGRMLMQQCAPTMKKLSLELGGNAPFIVFNDADVDAAIEGAMLSKYRNTGQTCVCSNRFLVQSGVYQEFAEKLTARVAQLKVGDGLHSGVQQGPLIDETAINNIEALVNSAKIEGASVLTGGERHSLGGTFFQPTVLSNVTMDMKISSEEIFGPVSPLIAFEDDEQAISIANNTEFGLAAYFYSRDIGRVWHIAEELEYGMVGINTGIISTEVAPFGGVKSSGNGREGSKYGLDDYMEIKYLAMGGL